MAADSSYVEWLSDVILIEKKANGLLANWKFNRSQIGATLLPQSEVFPEVNLYPPCFLR